MTWSVNPALVTLSGAGATTSPGRSAMTRSASVGGASGVRGSALSQSGRSGADASGEALGSDEALASGAGLPPGPADEPGGVISSMGSHRTLAWIPFGSAVRSRILNATSNLAALPAAGIALMSGDEKRIPLEVRLGVAAMAPGRPRTAAAGAAAGAGTDVGRRQTGPQDDGAGEP